MSLYELTVIGNITRDGEIKSNPTTGKPYVQFDIAVNVTKTQVQYIQCSLNNEKLVAVLPPFLVKGKKVWLRGQPKSGSYTAKGNGNIVNTMNLYVSQIELLSPKENAETYAPMQQPSYASNSTIDDGPVW